MFHSILDGFVPKWVEELDSLEKSYENLVKTGTSEQDRGWQPPTNIVEYALGYVILLEIPGLQKNNLDIRVSNGKLIVEGTRTFLSFDNERVWLKKEIRDGKFGRVFSLGANLDTENIEAKYEGGVLKIYIPKKMKKEIEIL